MHRFREASFLSRTLLLDGAGLLIFGAAVFAAVFIHDRPAHTTMSVRWAAWLAFGAALPFVAVRERRNARIHRAGSPPKSARQAAAAELFFLLRLLTPSC
ncbi:MAG: hypothetical protein OXG43_11545 [Chloroflexi bacterium]|nr:hypothetical protein [Chloroflexota bacterium]